MKTFKLLRGILVALATILPPAIVLLVIFRHGVNVPYWDDWELVLDLEKLHTGHLTLVDLFRQHNEHRIVFPRLLMLGLSTFNRWNILHELYASWIFIGVTLLLLWSLLRITFKDLNGYKKLFILAHSLLLFSLCQRENLIWGWQLQWFFADCFIVLSIWSLSYWKGRWIGIIASAVAAFVATYSIASALVMWILALFMLIIEKKHWNLKHIFFWVAIAIPSIVYYFLGFEEDESHIYTFLYHPIQFLHFLFATLGAPFGSIGGRQALLLSTVAGILGFLTFGAISIWMIAKNPEWRSKFLPWFILALYGFCSVALTAIGRVKYGVEKEALISRYWIFSLIFWCGAIVPILFFFANFKTATAFRIRMGLIVIGLFFLLGYSATAVRQYDRMFYYNKRFEIGKMSLYDYSTAKDYELKTLTFLPADVIRARAAFLESQRLGPYANGSGAELVQRILNGWDQEVRHLNLDKVSVPAESIFIPADEVIETKRNVDVVRFISKTDRGINFSLKYEDIPNWKNNNSQRIVLIYSQTASYLRVSWRRFGRTQYGQSYGLPIERDWKVFRFVLPGHSKNIHWRLDYLMSPAFEDQLKVICFTSATH